MKSSSLPLFLFFFLLLLAPALAAACGGSTSSGGSLSPDAFALSYAHAICDDLGACCKAGGLGYDANDCLVAAAGEAQVTYVNPALAVNATYDPAAAAACIAALTTAAQSCDDTRGEDADGTLAWQLACAGVYAGTKGPGDACRSAAECAPGPSGSSVSCVEWYGPVSDAGGMTYGSACQLTVAGTLGAACGDSPSEGPPPATVADCTLGGLRCDATSSTCQSLSALGGPCENDAACADGAICPNGTCTTAPPIGGTCNETHCGRGDYCEISSNTCRTSLPTGAACPEGDECAAFCDLGVCTTSALASPYLCGG